MAGIARCASVVGGVAVLVASGSALGGFADFDGVPECDEGSPYVSGGIEFTNDFGVGFKTDQADGTLGGDPSLSPPNILGAFGIVPGPQGGGGGQIGWIEMRTGQAETFASLDVYVTDIVGLGNTVTLSARSGVGDVVASTSFVITNDPTSPLVHEHLELDVPGGFAYLRLESAGAASNGQMVVSLDNVLIETPAPACVGDLDGDDDTDVFDFGLFATNFGSGPGATPEQGDLNGDGFVNVFDFGLFATDFGCGG